MIRLIVFFAIATVLALVAVWLAERPGSVTIEWLGTVYNTRVDVAILGLVLLVLVGIICFEILRWIRILPRRMRERRAFKKQIKGYQSLVGGLVAAAAGDSRKARTLKNQADGLLKSDPQTLLLSAQTAQLDGDEDLAEISYRRMLKAPETSLLGLRGLLSQAIKLGEYDEAATLAKQAYEKSPTTPWVLDTYFDILARKRNWEAALKLVDEMGRAKTQSEGDLAHKRSALLHMIASGMHERGENSQALSMIRKAVKLCPDFAPAAVQGAAIALAMGRPRVGRRMVEDAWSVEPHPELAKALGGLVKREPEAAQKKRWRRLQDLRPNHPQTHISLAELAVAQKDMQLAKRHAQQAVDKGGTVAAYQLLAQIEHELGAKPERLQQLRDQASNAALDYGWVCQDTLETVNSWQPFGLSGRFDAIAWMQPSKIARYQALAGPDALAIPADNEAPTRASDAKIVPLNPERPIVQEQTKAAS